MRRLLLALSLLFLAAPAWAQIVRTDIKKTLINSSSASAESTGTSCATSSRTFNGTQYFSEATGTDPELGTQDWAAAVPIYLHGAPPYAVAYAIYNGGSNAINGGWSINLATATTAPKLAGLWSDGAAGHITGCQGATTLLQDTWYYVAVHGDRDGVLECVVNGLSDDATPADISAGSATDISNTAAFQVGTVGAYGYVGRMASFAVWEGAIGSTVPTLSQLKADTASTLTLKGCGDWTVTPTRCYPMNGAAGANEEDAIGSHDLAQTNSPGSADGPGEGCE